MTNFSTFEVRGTDAVRILNERRMHFGTTGEYPFLIGDEEEFARLEEAAEFTLQDPAEIIQLSSKLDPVVWLQDRRKEAEKYEFSQSRLLGDWPDEVPEKGSITLHKDIVTGKVQPKVYIGLANIELPWQLPAIVKYGGWNACPLPDVHCAIHKIWFEQFGAEIIGMSGDTVECTVKSPPTTREAAIELAWQQYWYCGDIVDQGCETISYLAAWLINSPYWYFWWD